MNRFTEGAYDIYVHGGPDIIPRQSSDIDLAQKLKEAGYAAAVHRHHFTETAGRARLVRDVTGFRMLGAILLNDAVGGINPTAVEYALRTGAVWVGLPTVDACLMRAEVERVSPQVAATSGIGRIVRTLPGEMGRITPELSAVFELVAQHDAVLALGKLSGPETLAVAKAARVCGVSRMVLSNPMKPAFPLDEVMAVLSMPGVWLEVSAYQFHPDSIGDIPPDSVAALVRAVGAGRAVLSSDGGVAGTLAPPLMLSWACNAFIDAGISERQVLRMVRENPRELLGPGAEE